MGLQAVPDDQQPSAQVGAKRLQELDMLLFLDRSFVQSEHEVGARQPGDDRDVRPIEVKLDNRCLTFGCPGSHARRSLAQARLVDEDDQPVLPLRFFLSAGQVFRFQICTAPSSRSMARRSGFCAEKPKARSTRQTCATLYLTS